LNLPDLIVITDWSLHDLLARIESVAALGPRVAVLHRNPSATARAYFDQARALSAICAHTDAAFFIHSRLDIALVLGAHLHLPSTGLLARDVRAHLGTRWISASAHDEAERASTEGADLILLSPVFAPTSKPADRAPLGVDGFTGLAQHTRARPYALGGITPETARAIPPYTGLAAIGGILHARDPRAAAEQLLATRRPPESRSA
jgi:thiamine-phosphate pyrophosphorylase